MKKANSKLKKAFLIVGSLVVLLVGALVAVKLIGVRTILISLGLKSDKKILFLGDSTTSYIKDYEDNPIRPYEYYFTLKQDRETTNVAIPMASFSTIRENNINSEIDSIHLEEYDTVFFLFGVNDYVAVCDGIGDVDSRDKATLCGAMNVAIDRIEEAGIKNIYCITPFPIYHQFSGETNGVHDSFDLYLSNIRNVCEMRKIPVIEFNTELGVTEDNYKEYYIDEYHPRNELHEIAADYLYEYMKKAEPWNFRF